MSLLSPRAAPPRPLSPAPAPGRDGAASARLRWQVALFAGAVTVLLAAAASLLADVAKLSLSDETHSHVLLVPFVSAWLVWLRRRELSAAGERDDSRAEPIGRNRPVPRRRSRIVTLDWRVGVLLAAAAALFLGTRGIFSGSVAPDVVLSGRMAALVLTVAGLAAACFGPARLRLLAASLAFLLFAVPIPDAAVTAVQTFLQHGSLIVAHGLFQLTGTPVLDDGLVIKLPGFSMEVAPQCSGFRATWALLMTAVLAGLLFFRAGWKRLILVIAVLPLALLRNGLRIFVIGHLCVHVGPEMIQSPIHVSGGPFFFALSLVPFGALLFWLRRVGQTTARHAL